MGKRTAFRTVALLGAIVGLVGWRRRGDPRFLPFAALLAFLLGVAYFGAYTFFAQTQPYRNILPAGFAATIVGAAALEHAVRHRVFRSAGRRIRVALGVLAIPAGLLLVQDALYFSVKSLPELEPLPHGERVVMSAMGYPPHAFYGYADWENRAIAQWVREHDDRSGRFLVQGWPWGEQLTWTTDAQILGGFIWRNLQHSWANFFRRRPQGIAKPDEFRHYLRTYAVRWVIISSPRTVSPWWDKNPLLQHVADVGAFRVYGVREPTGFIAKGPGVARGSTNRIEVTGTDPDAPVVLRYHWLETLTCTPDCTIERRPIKGDPVGFIHVPAPHPSDFTISNEY